MNAANETASSESGRHDARKSSGLIDVDGLTSAKPMVREAVDVLEQLSYLHFRGERAAKLLRSEWWIYASAKDVQRELQSLIRSARCATFMNLSSTFWQQAVNSRHATILFCRDLSPLATAFLHWSMGAKVFSERLLEGNMEEENFPKLTAAAGNLAGAPVRICDVRTPDTFLQMLFETHTMFDYAVCDWELAGEELAGACRMTCNSRIKFLLPSQNGKQPVISHRNLREPNF